MTKKNTITVVSIIMLPVLAGCILFSLSQFNKDSSLALSQQTKKIGIVKIIDVIIASEEYVRQLEEMRKDNEIAGVILRIDSPGGAVAPSQEIYQEAMRFREANKLLVVSMGNVAASGGYYIAAPAQKIFSNPGTITGSIGVIFQFPQYNKLLDKIGVRINTFKAGEFKDIGNPNREMSDKEKQYIQALLDNTHEQFIQDVCKARGMDIKKLRPLANGRIFTGQQAKEAGLVDTLGGLTEAISYCKKQTGVPEKSKLVEKTRTTDFVKDMFSEKLSSLFPFLKNRFIPAGCYYL